MVKRRPCIGNLRWAWDVHPPSPRRSYSFVLFKMMNTTRWEIDPHYLSISALEDQSDGRGFSGSCFQPHRESRNLKQTHQSASRFPGELIEAEFDFCDGNKQGPCRLTAQPHERLARWKVSSNHPKGCKSGPNIVSSKTGVGKAQCSDDCNDALRLAIKSVPSLHSATCVLAFTAFTMCFHFQFLDVASLRSHLLT